MKLGFSSKQLPPDITRCRMRRAAHVLTTAQGDEVVLFDAVGERYFTLNDVGRRVWTMLAEPTTLAEIVAAIRGEYHIPGELARDHVERDVTRLLRELHTAGLVAIAPSAARAP